MEHGTAAALEGLCFFHKMYLHNVRQLLNFVDLSLNL